MRHAHQGISKTGKKDEKRNWASSFYTELQAYFTPIAVSDNRQGTCPSHEFRRRITQDNTARRPERGIVQRANSQSCCRVHCQIPGEDSTVLSGATKSTMLISYSVLDVIGSLLALFFVGEHPTSKGFDIQIAHRFHCRSLHNGP